MSGTTRLSGANANSSNPRGASGRLIGWVDVVVIVVVSFVSVRVHMEAFPQISPFDEATHISYVLSLSDLEVPELGRPYDEVVLSEWSCRGSYSETLVLPSCDSASFDFSNYPGRGVQRNKTPPLYYAITAALTKPALALTDQSVVGMARLVGSLFLSVGLLGMIHAARQLGSSRWPTLIVASSVPFAVPTVLHATSTVNSDALVFAFGGVAIAVGVAIVRGVVPVWGLFALAVVGGLSKQTAVFPVIAASVIVLAGLVWPVDGAPPMRKPGRTAALALSAPVISLLVIGVWWQIARLWTPADFANPIGNGNSRDIVGSPIDEIFAKSFGLLPPTKLTFIPVQIRTQWHEPWSQVLTVLVLGSFGAAISSRRAQIRGVGAALLVACIANVIVIQGVLVLTRGTAFPEVTSRYAVGLVPLAMCVVCVIIGRRWVAWTVAAALAVGSLAVGSASLIV